MEYYWNKRDTYMLRWAFIFLIIALIAGLFGFGFVAGTALSIAKILFFIFIVLFVITLILGITVFKKVKSGVQDLFNK